MKNLETPNLILREFTPLDITETYIKALNDHDIVGLTEARHKSWNSENIVEYIENSNKEEKSILIGIFLKPTDKPIGNIRLFNFHPVHKRCELGIMLYDRSEWGKGFGTEALNRVISYVFKDLKLHRIVADYYKPNIASSKIFKKAGFEIEGIFKDHFLLNGSYIDSVRIAKINNEK